jgi:cold shock protein
MHQYQARAAKCLKTYRLALYEIAKIEHNPPQSGKLSDPVELRVENKPQPAATMCACLPPITVLPAKPKTWSGGHVFFVGEEECYPMRQTGTVKFFNQAKGFGFITPDEGGKDVFVHISAVERSGVGMLDEGMRITYETQPDPKGKGPKAVNIERSE